MSKIEWCDFTWNPVWGCLNNCRYCYARKFANRFKEKMAEKEWAYHYSMDYYIDSLAEDTEKELIQQFSNFIPTWIESNFTRNFPKKPSNIFVNSMSDICFWEEKWMKIVVEKIKQYSQHNFLFLSKNPYIYEKYNFWSNCWCGITITNNKDLEFQGKKPLILNLYCKYVFLSIEPIQKEINNFHYFKYFSWVIIGAETGNRKNKIIPKKEWIQNIVNFCKDNNIPVFLKNNLQKIWDDDLIQERLTA